jgi:recombination protein RecT
MSDSEPKPTPPTRATTMRLSDAKTIGDALMTTQFQRAVADAAPQHMTAQRLMATFRQAARNNPAFHQCNLMSVLGVFMTCGFLGLEPNTPLGHAYMIPFAKKRYDKASRQLVDDGYDLQLIIGYQGYLDLAYRNPRVSSIAAHAVYEGDDFSFEYGSNEHLQHRPKGLHADGDVPRYFYMFSKLQGGQAFEVLPTSKVLQIRNGSQGYRAALSAKERAEEKGWKIPASYTEAPWVKHFVAMGQKTAMRAGYKWLPKTVEMAAVTRLEDAQDRGAIDFGPVLEGKVNPLDEDLPPLYVERADPGAAFGERSNDDDGGDQDERRVPARTTPAQRQTKPSAPPTPTPAAPAPQPPQGAPGQGFAAYLADAAGDIVEGFGDGGYITNADAFAVAYAEVWIGTQPSDRQSLAEHNADGLEDAALASPKAASILNALVERVAELPAAEAPVQTGAISVVVAANGRPDLKGYLDALRNAAQAQDATTFPAWSDLQRPIILGLSQVTKRAAEKIVADRASALGTDKPAAAQPIQPAQDGDEPPPPTGDDAQGDEPVDDDGLMGTTLPPTAWSRSAQSLVDSLMACRSLHDLDALGNNAATKVAFRLVSETDADEGTRLRAFATQRRADLSPGQRA